MTRTIFIAAGLALAATLSAMPANAQGAIRTFVSVSGSDSNPCSIIAPCRHFSAAVALTSAGGEVDALDPGAYGSFTISQAITIEGQGWSYVAPPNGEPAITINAGGDVTIRGISLNGVGTTNTDGIAFYAGSSLTVTDCVVQNFGLAGIRMEASSPFTFAITNTIVSKSHFYGILYAPYGSGSVQGIIDHVTATGNSEGIFLNTSNQSVTTTIAISNSIASDNSDTGILTGSGASAILSFSVDNTDLSGNLTGIAATGQSRVLLGRSVIMGNSTQGIDNETSPNAFYTYQNNQINFNGTSNTVGGSPLLALPFQ
jgi:Right handed beta helix region